MCFDDQSLGSAANNSPATTNVPSPASILAGGVGGAGGSMPSRQSGISRAVNNPISTGASTAAGIALAPATMGLSMLIPVATKLIGGLLSKKPRTNYGNPSPDTDAGLNSLASKSFGGI